MAFILSPETVAKAIGAKSSGVLPTAENDKFIAMLSNANTRIEGICGVDTIARAQNTDTFDIRIRGPKPEQRLLTLRNGFLDSSSISVIGPSGSEVPDTDYRVDAEKGVISLKYATNGEYAASYVSGFEYSGDPAEYINTPEWMKNAVHAFAVSWFKSVQMNIHVPNDVAYWALMSPLYRQMAASIYPHYQRPRGYELPVAHESVLVVPESPTP